MFLFAINNYPWFSLFYIHISVHFIKTQLLLIDYFLCWAYTLPLPANLCLEVEEVMLMSNCRFGSTMDTIFGSGITSPIDSGVWTIDLWSYSTACFFSVIYDNLSCVAMIDLGSGLFPAPTTLNPLFLRSVYSTPLMLSAMVKSYFSSSSYCLAESWSWLIEDTCDYFGRMPGEMVVSPSLSCSSLVQTPSIFFSSTPWIQFCSVTTP